MSRHRNVRGMNYDDDYDGYDEVYGHSVEDDTYGVSPGTAEEFLYRRSYHEHHLGKYMDKIGEGEEEDEENTLADSKTYQKPKLNDVDEARLQSCLEGIRNVVGDGTPEHILIEAVLSSHFVMDKAIDAILNQEEASSKDSQHSKGASNHIDLPTRSHQRVPQVRANDLSMSKVTGDVTRMSFPATKKPVTGFYIADDDSGGERVATPPKVTSPTRRSSLPVPPMAGRLLGDSTDRLPKVASTSDLGAMGGSNSRPSSRPTSPSTGRRDSKVAKSSIDIAKEYAKRQSSGKELINLVVIGHVDAGKSTLMGHLLYLLGQVNQRQMHKYETESKKQGKASFAYAWVLDETGEERERGITMDVGLTRFETPNRIVTLLDAPGHKDFIPNMITGAAQADVAILVVNATNGEFESGFESGGQTREHALLVRSLGVTQLAVAVNKLDTVDWSKDRFKDITSKLRHFLKQVGFKEADVEYIPCSGLTGENLKEKATEPKLTQWYKGPCLVEQIDKLKPPERAIDRPFRLCVSDVFKGMGAGFSIAGKIESGSVQVGDKVQLIPVGETGTVKGVSIHDVDTRWACAGDHAALTVTGMDQNNVTIGCVLCTMEDPIKSCTRFRARVIMFNIDVPVTRGFPILLHYQTVSEPAIIRRLISTLHKSTGEILQKKPKCLTKQSNALIEIETTRPICLELYKDHKDLGRFMIRYAGSTIGAGVVTELK
ncbi:HBS1-like protein isoform X1 [Amphiura filiformis]|uniref:HBS1-like protein isoform X1 n=1 Tax=Amphiura filiformis TaxID=82378 RepID=UPI003B223413